MLTNINFFISHLIIQDQYQFQFTKSGEDSDSVTYFESEEDSVS